MIVCMAMIWILDENRGLAFEWNESKTINVYPLTCWEDGTYSIGLAINCYEWSMVGDIDDFKESVADYDY